MPAALPQLSPSHPPGPHAPAHPTLTPALLETTPLCPRALPHDLGAAPLPVQAHLGWGGGWSWPRALHSSSTVAGYSPQQPSWSLSVLIRVTRTVPSPSVGWWKCGRALAECGAGVGRPPQTAMGWPQMDLPVHAECRPCAMGHASPS